MSLLILIIFTCLGISVGFCILGALSYFMIVEPFPYQLSMVATQFFKGVASFPLLAIPMFILAGELMNESGITSRIIVFANLLVGRMKAGLALVNIWASVIFAGLSGSAIADTSALGRVFIPEMEKRGYPKDFAAAITAASSVIGPIIPPSIPVIIYALTVTGVSVPGLFMAGVVPGLLLAVALSIYVMVFKSHHETPQALNKNFKEIMNIIVQCAIPIGMPIFIVGSILFGIVTPTEAASFAVAYALVVGLFIFKELKFKSLPNIFARSMRDAAIIMFIIAAVAAANWLLNYNRIPNMITDFSLQYMNSKVMYLIFIIFIFFIVGLFLEGIAAMLVLVPILHPIGVSLGVDPTHLGIIIILNLMIGLITPPMGLCLFVADSIANVGIPRLAKQIFPLLLVELLVLVLITFVPDLSLFLPKLLGLLK